MSSVPKPASVVEEGKRPAPSSASESEQESKRAKGTDGAKVTPASSHATNKWRRDGFVGVTPYLAIRGASDAIAWYERAFGAKEAYRMGGGGVIGHAELDLNGCKLMLADEMNTHTSPKKVGGSPVSSILFVPDCDGFVARAEKEGAEVLFKPDNMFWGDRWSMIRDPFGHRWQVATHLEEVPTEEIQKRFRDMFQQFNDKTREIGDASWKKVEKKVDASTQHISPGHTPLTPCLTVRGVRDAIEFYTKTFGAKEVYRLECPTPDLTKLEGAKKEAAEKAAADNPGGVNCAFLELGGGMLMLTCECAERGELSPLALGGSTASACVYVPNVDVLWERVSKAPGVKVERPIADQFYGDRSFHIVDPFGHKWSFERLIRDMTHEEIKAEAAKVFAGSHSKSESEPMKLDVCRTFKGVSRERVWDAWMNRSKLPEWYAAPGMKMKKATVDPPLNGEHITEGTTLHFLLEKSSDEADSMCDTANVDPASLKTVRESVQINAPASAVFTVLTTEAQIRRWAGAFGTGLHATATEWKSGGIIEWKMGSMSCNKGQLTIEPDRLVHCDFLASMNQPHQTGDMVERYELFPSADGQSCRIETTCGPMTEAMANMMAPAWPKAVERIKLIAEGRDSELPKDATFGGGGGNASAEQQQDSAPVDPFRPFWELWKFEKVSQGAGTDVWSAESTRSFCDENRSIIHNPFSNTWPLRTKTIMTVSSEDNGSSAKLTFQQEPDTDATPDEKEAFASQKHLAKMALEFTLQQLETHLTKQK